MEKKKEKKKKRDFQDLFIFNSLFIISLISY